MVKTKNASITTKNRLQKSKIPQNVHIKRFKDIEDCQITKSNQLINDAKRVKNHNIF